MERFTGVVFYRKIRGWRALQLQIIEDKAERRCYYKKGIQGTVDTLRDFGHEDAEIKKAIIKRYNLSLEETEDYLRNI